jgi:Ca-activated chloride channel family protein
MGMSFANPSALMYLVILAVLALATGFFVNRLQKKLSLWIGRDQWKTVIPEYSKPVYLFKNIFLMMSAVFFVIALARPQWGEHEEILHSEGMDIFFVLDLSTSMLSEDVPPSRLRRAQTFIKKTMANLPNDRVGVVAFAGTAFIAAPLTTDFGYIGEMVDSLDPSSITNQGTDLGQALDVAVKAFERSAEGDQKISRAVIVVSDGEDFGTSAEKGAEEVKDFGAQFITLSVGTAEGAPIPNRNESGVLQDYKKDQSGKPILSRANKSLMQKIADAGNGKFIDLVNADDAAYAVAKSLSSASRNSQKEQRQVTKIERFQYFVAAAFLFLLLHLLLGYQSIWKSARLEKIKPVITTALTLLLCFGFLNKSASAQTFDSYLKSRDGMKKFKTKDFDGSVESYEQSRKNDSENPAILFNEATGLAEVKKTDEAKMLFSEATKKALQQGDYETAAKSLYNEGLMHSEAKNLPEAYDRLTKAIEMAKISKQPELEKHAREALVQNIEKQKQQSKEDKEKKDKKGEGKEDKPGDQKESPGDNGKKPEDQKGGPPKLQQHGFKSGTLSKDVAESIMNDLSDREKQLYQKRNREKKGKEMNHDKDW